MPTYVDPQACNACAEVAQGPLCVYICPNDLMVLRPDIKKGFNQEPEMCSECYACVKLCPEEAIHVRGYADFVPWARWQPRESSRACADRQVPGRAGAALPIHRGRSGGSTEPHKGLPRTQCRTYRVRHWLESV
jgi:adenosine phosphosulfate reductase beta subunit